LGRIGAICEDKQGIGIYVVKDPDNPSEGGDWLWAEAGKYSSVATAHLGAAERDARLARAGCGCLIPAAAAVPECG
jgi:hypothetical protein